MDKERLIQLLQAYRTDAITDEDRIELLGFIATDRNGGQTIPALESLLESAPASDQPIDRNRWQPILEAILRIDKAGVGEPILQQHRPPQRPIRRIQPKWIRK